MSNFKILKLMYKLIKKIIFLSTTWENSNLGLKKKKKTIIIKLSSLLTQKGNWFKSIWLKNFQVWNDDGFWYFSF